MVGLIVAVIGGTIIEKLQMENYVEEFIRSAKGIDIEAPNLAKRERVGICKGASGINLQKGVAIYFGRRGNWCHDTQLDSPKLDRACVGKP